MMLPLFVLMTVSLGEASSSSDNGKYVPRAPRCRAIKNVGLAGRPKTGLRIGTVTWNLANDDALEANLQYWINPVIAGNDVFVIALQESNQNVTIFQEMVEKHIASLDGCGFKCVCAEALGFKENIKILMFVKQEYADAIEASMAIQKICRGGVLKTSFKGGYIVKFDYQGMRYCFVAAHLCAGQKEKKLDTRERDTAAIMRLVNETHNDYIIFMGDLNYRLNYRDDGMKNKHVLGKKKKKKGTLHKKGDWDAQEEHLEILKTILTAITANNLEELRKHDELNALRENPESPWAGFQEADINFKPSYCVLQEKGLHYDIKRFPAYCDRVLYRCNAPVRRKYILNTIVITQPSIECLEYGMFPEPEESDHKPVYAVLETFPY